MSNFVFKFTSVYFREHESLPFVLINIFKPRLGYSWTLRPLLVTFDLCFFLDTDLPLIWICDENVGGEKVLCSVFVKIKILCNYVLLGVRKQYRTKDEAFLEKHLVSKEPFGQFKAWFEEVRDNKDIIFPGAMCLATVSQEGYPSARYVICTSFDKDGFKFFTDYSSRKSKEMDRNPNVAATFNWNVLDRSVRIEGYVEKLSEEESVATFKTRPIDSQIAVLSCSQSAPLESKYLLRERVSDLKTQFMMPGKEVPKPSYWGGYIIRPRAVEFWQGQTNRLSDRIRFRKSKDGETPDGKMLHEGEDDWVYERLSP